MDGCTDFSLKMKLFCCRLYVENHGIFVFFLQEKEKEELKSKKKQNFLDSSDEDEEPDENDMEGRRV